MKAPFLSLLTFLLLLSCSNNNSKQENELPAHNREPARAYPWQGKWERNIWQNDASLEIKKVTGDSSLEFELHASSGANLGDIEGKAIIKDDIAIYYSREAGDDCMLSFKILGDSLIIIKLQQGSCLAGMGVTYEGNYINSKNIRDDKKTETLFSLGVFESAADDSIFKELTKKDYGLFLHSTQLTSEDYDIDSLNAKVCTSGIRGLYTFMENIIMIDPEKHIWAAVIDDNKVLYFTNDAAYADKLPQTIESWRSRFRKYKVVYKQ